MSMRGTEKLEIQLVDEGEDWFRGTIRTYFTHGGARVRKYKFVARIRPRPNGVMIPLILRVSMRL